MSDLNHQNIATVNSNLQPAPVTIASATTVAPTTFLTFISGTIAIGTITPPVTGAHMLVFIYTSTTPGTVLTTGNVVNAIVPTFNLPTFLVYNPITGKYHGGTTNLT